MVSVSLGDTIDPDHFDDLSRQLVDNYALVLGQKVSALQSDSFNAAGTINDFYVERLAVDIVRFYHHTQVGSLTLEQAYDTLYSNSSGFNDGNEPSETSPQVATALIRHEDINQMQNGIDLARLAGVPSYTDFPIDSRIRTQGANVAANDDGAKIYCPLLVTWDTDSSYDITNTYSGGITTVDGTSNNKIRYFSQCGGRINIFAEGLNSDGTSKDNDVKNMLDSVNTIHNPWPLTNIQLSENWNSYTVLQTVNSNSAAYGDNVLQLVCRRNSVNELYYALRYTDSSDGQGSGLDYSEELYDEEVTTDFSLTVHAYYPGHLLNNYRPDVQVGD